MQIRKPQISDGTSVSIRRRGKIFVYYEAGNRNC